MSIYERLYMQLPTTKPRVYKILPESRRWWVDCIDANGSRHLYTGYSHAEALAKAADYAAGVFE